MVFGERKFGWLLLALVMGLLAGVSACEGEEEATDDGDAPEDGGAVSCEGDVCTLSGTYTEDLTLTADKEWLLRGGVFIGDDVGMTVLTVEPGTKVYGETSTQGFLVIRRGSKILAEGTKEAPIVFTSSKAEGSRARGDWGGLIINGRAKINACAEETGNEGVCEAFGEGGTGFYGGDNDADNSGVLKYVRIEFGGRLISPDNELNCLALQGVGSGTEVDYVQLHMGKDDGLEFFGGTAQVKHVVITGAADDSLDWTDGWRGKAQFVVVQQYEDGGDNGVEADNNGDQNSASPRSMPVVSNLTVLGSPGSEASDIGVLLREGTAGELHNAVVAGFGEACLDVDHAETFAQAGSGLKMAQSVMQCDVLYGSAEDDPSTVESFFTGGEGNGVADPMLEDPFNTGAPNWRPKSGSPVLMGAVQPGDGFFEDVSFRGAVGSEDWTAGWTSFVRN